MANISTSVRQVPQYVADGVPGDIRLNRRNEIITTDFLTQASLEGRLFCANMGTLTTPVTFAASGTIVGTIPCFMVTVPAGTTIIPVSIRVYYETFGTTAQMEIMAAVGTGGVRAAGTAITPTCMRSDAPNTSNCSIYGTALTGCTYMTTNVSEFWRDGQQYCITKTTANATATASDPFTFTWRLIDSLTAPVCVGASQLMICQGSQAGTGFIEFIYAEYPSTAIV